MASSLRGLSSSTKACWAPLGRRVLPLANHHSHITSSPFFRTVAVPETRKRGLASSTETQRKPDQKTTTQNVEITLDMVRGLLSSSGGNGFNHSAEEYYACLTSFCQVARARSSQWTNDWTVTLPNHSAQVLHETACLFMFTTNSTLRGMSTAMLASAANQGHNDARLTVIRGLIHAGSYGHAQRTAKLEREFREIVAAGRDPNALTVEGERLYRDKRYSAALKVLRRALGPDGDRGFAWRANCKLCLARTYVALGRKDEARAEFEDLASLGVPEAELEVGMALRQSDPDRARELIHRAACKGKPELFSLLAEMALEGSSSTSQGPKDTAARKEDQRWALEWSRVADPRAEY